MKFAFIIDPIHLLDPGHDTSVALMEAAGELGHEVWITQASHLSVVDGKAMAVLERVDLTPVQLVEGLWVAQSPWYRLGDRAFRHHGCGIHANRSAGNSSLSLRNVYFGLYQPSQNLSNKRSQRH